MNSLRIPSTTRRSAPSRRGRAGLATFVAFVTIPLAAGCGAGFDAASQQVKPDAGSGTVGDLKVGNVWLIVDAGSGKAEVIGSVANTGTAEAQLTGVQADGTSATVRPPASAPAPGYSAVGDSLTIAQGGSVNFGERGYPQLVMSGGSFTPGSLAQVTFTFAQGGALTVSAQIEPDQGLFAAYVPYVAPSPSPTPSVALSGSASASASATSTSGASASGTASASATAKH